MWKAELSRYLPRTSMPLTVISLNVVLVHVTHELREVDFLSFWPSRALLTTSHSNSAETPISSQNSTVFTVEFT